MKFWTAVFLIAPISSSAFLQSGGRYARSSTSSASTASHLFATTDPKELTEYMAKAHEEKLKAVQLAETKKNAEIQKLKEELKALQSSNASAMVATSPPNAGMDMALLSKEQLLQKIISYQQFMAKYIVDSQQQKTKAIAAAETAVRLKYEEKLQLLLSGSGVPTVGAVATASSSPAFQQRSARVSAAAAAGKSRWGDMENQKASQVVIGSEFGVVPVNGFVQINGAPPTLASSSLSSSPPSSSVSSLPAFEKRNVMVAAAGKAGKSRWGEMEVDRATQAAGAALPLSSTSTSTLVTPEVEAADHGLRADGGVGGPTLAERVNLGSLLLSGPAATHHQLLGNTPSPTTTYYYDKRNAMIAAAGLAGKSRWGDLEVHRAQSLVASLPPSRGNPIVSPEIEAADHGLRADGGVSGPSLAQRVNFGAALLSQ